MSEKTQACEKTQKCDEIQYPEQFTERLQLLWGRGFLSPGGQDEVGEIVKGLDLNGKSVLDIGTGVGGPALTLARDHHAGSVIGIDIEPQLIKQAVKNIREAGLSDIVQPQLVNPGPLPFSNDTFDLVFSKDSMIHIPDKPALFLEIIRVLKPGGVFVASDWLSGGGENAIPALERFKVVHHLAFAIASAARMEERLVTAGFTDVQTRDRNDWFAKISRFEVEQLEGPLNAQLQESFGADYLAHWIDVKKAIAVAAEVGGLRPTHLRGFKALR